MLRILILLIVITQCISCKKEGTGGKAVIKGTVTHHAIPVPNAMVYIKYGTTEFSGIDPSNYDASIKANADSEFEFKDLRKGKYYLFSIGYDSAIFQTVRGGMPMTITNKSESKKIDLPVTE